MLRGSKRSEKLLKFRAPLLKCRGPNDRDPMFGVVCQGVACFEKSLESVRASSSLPLLQVWGFQKQGFSKDSYKLSALV